MITRGTDEVAERVLNLHASRTSTRQGIFDPVWQDLSNYFLPQLSDINIQKTEGVTGWTDDIFDTTAIWANQVCAAGHRNWCTPSNEKWLAFTAPDLLPNKDAAAPWYARCTEIALKLLGNSNFYTTIHEFYLGRGGFGTDIIHCEEGRRNPLCFSKFKIGTYNIQEDDEGFIDTMSRDIELTARQAVMKFGLENVGPNCRKAYEGTDAKSIDKKFKFVHEIRPREPSERKAGKRDPENKPVSSVYVDLETRRVVLNSGYEEQPFMVSRFLRWGTTPWGFSPAFLALPNVRELNYVVRFMDALAEIRANPRILAPASGKSEFDLRGGGVSYVDPDDMARGVVPKEWMTQGDFDIGLKLIEMKREDVKRMFFVDLFNMLNEAGNQSRERMTAEEVRARISEKLEQFSPTFDRLTTELLNPLLRRVFGLLYRGNHFPAPPQEVMVPVPGTPDQVPAMPEIEYTSRIALQLRSMRNKAFMDTIQVVGQIAQQVPNVVDNFDVDKGIRTFAIDNGIDPDLVRPLDGKGGVIKIREERLKKQQEAEALAKAEQAASAAGKLGKAPRELQNRMMQGMPSGG